MRLLWVAFFLFTYNVLLIYAHQQYRVKNKLPPNERVSLVVPFAVGIVGLMIMNLLSDKLLEPAAKVVQSGGAVIDTSKVILAAADF